jgi:hypothetical protein
LLNIGISMHPLNATTAQQTHYDLSLPVDDDAALQSKAVLIVVVAAHSKSAAVAEPAVEVFKLDKAQGDFLAHLDLKATADRQGESIARKAVAIGGCDAVSCTALTSDRGAHSTEVKFGKWFELAGISVCKSWPKKVCKLTPADRVTDSVSIAKYFAPAQIGSQAYHAAKVVLDRTPTARAI